jgi:hypothetical protein
LKEIEKLKEEIEKLKWKWFVRPVM